MKVFEYRDDLVMFRRFAEHTLGFGFHIANAKLFVLGQMIVDITGRAGYGYEHDPRLFDILRLIAYAKEVTANEKTIYLHTIIDWLDQCIQAIDKQREWDKRLCERDLQEHLDQINQQSNIAAAEAVMEGTYRIDDFYSQQAPPDTMGDIPF